MAYSAYLSIFDIFCILIIFLFVTARIDDGDETLGSQGSQNWWECAPQGRPLVPKRPLCRSRDVKRRFFRHSNQHMEPRQGSTAHYTLPGWRWHSQQGLMLWDGKWFCMAMLERWASMQCFLCFQIKLRVFCMNTMIHSTPLWACLLSLWTEVVSVFTASSDQIRCTCTIYVSYEKYVHYANICNSMHILHILHISFYC